MSGSCFACILGEVCGVHLLPCIPRAFQYTIVYGQSAKRDVIPYLHAGLRGVIRRTRGVTTDGKDVIPYLHSGLRGVAGRTTGVITDGSEEQ